MIWETTKSKDYDGQRFRHAFNASKGDQSERVEYKNYINEV